MTPFPTGGIIFLVSTGFLFGFGLAYVAKKFATPMNPVEEEIIKLLPGANCGACGFPGCTAYAEAIISGQIEVGRCPVVGKDAANSICKLLGKETFEKERTAAVIFCAGGKNCKDKYIYDGIESCASAKAYFGGNKECSWGCLTLGECAKMCPFNAIKWERGSVPVIDEEKCTSCGSCIKVCPAKIIHLVPCKFRFHIRCASLDKGARVRQICKPGCIGCGICVKACPKNDIIFENNLAKMKYDACNNCGICMEKCPTKTIVRMDSPYFYRETKKFVGLASSSAGIQT